MLEVISVVKEEYVHATLSILEDLPLCSQDNLICVLKQMHYSRIVNCRLMIGICGKFRKVMMTGQPVVLSWLVKSLPANFQHLFLVLHETFTNQVSCILSRVVLSMLSMTLPSNYPSLKAVFFNSH